MIVHRTNPPGHTSLSEPVEAKILRLWRECRDTFEIAAETGLTEAEVANALHRLRERRRG